MNHLREQLDMVDIHIDDKRLQQFLTFYELLIEKNKVMNLTGITDKEEVILKHFVDSVLLMKEHCFENTFSCMDVGTGAGFPGIPLAIMNPDIHFVLLDSLNKRIRFILEVKDALGLTNLEAYHGRAEDFGRMPEYREQFDICVSRAVANLSSLSEFCIPFVKPSGYFVSYKSQGVEEEMDAAKNAVSLLGGNYEEVVSFSLPGTDISRSFVVVQKIKNTPEKYPRGGGKVLKKPL